MSTLMEGRYFWLKETAQGLFCLPGNFYIDPFVPVPFALITHGHSDHARAGHSEVIATAETLNIMQTRYGADFAKKYSTAHLFETIILNEVEVTFLPAGHILGSAQIQIDYQGMRVIFSGDYKRRDDPTCQPFFLQSSCDLLITEATFALPIFKFPPIEQEINKLLTSLGSSPHRCHLIGAYALGKCQRLILALRAAGYQKPIFLHGAMIKFCELYESYGHALGPLTHVSADNVKQLAGEIVLCPPAVLHDRWIRKFPDPIICYASGWMQNRFRAKQLGVELPLIISDHADWNELVQTIVEMNAPDVWITHGNEEALLYYSMHHGFKAKALSFLNYEDEE